MNTIYILTIAAVYLILMLGLWYLRQQNNALRKQHLLQAEEIENQKKLLQAVIEAQETERKRIGRDLHDDVGSTLSGLRMMIDIYQPDNVQKNSYEEFCNACKRIIDKIIRDVRNMSHNLSPSIMNFFGLYSAFEERCSIINRSGKWVIHLTNHTGNAANALGSEASTALYRVLEELINNTVKHAEATRIVVKFEVSDKTLVIEYKDNGKGIAPDVLRRNKGIGFQNIESRLKMIRAKYFIKTETDKGFCLLIECPLN